MEYACSICTYVTDHKKHAEKHINRLNKCGENPQVIARPVSIVCEFCNKSYTTKRSLKRHYTVCKTKKQQEEDEAAKEIAELKEKLARAEAKAEAKGGPQTVINNYIQVNINGYRDTSFEHLTDRHFKRAIGRMVNSVPQLIKDVHFNKKVPENHNIYISNIKNKYAMVYDGEKWCSKPQDQVIDDLISDQEYAIEEWLGEGDRFPKEMDKFNQYLEKKETEAPEGGGMIKDAIKEEVKLLLYNNRNLIRQKT